jgi:hypothetical protein
MKKLAVVVLVVAGLVKLVSGGGGNTHTQAHKACENLAKQCSGLVRLGGERLTANDVDQCTKDISNEANTLGDQYKPLVTCMADADSCGETLGCIGGAVMNEVGKELQGLDRGFRRMTK